MNTIKLIYVDESGNTSSSEKGSKYLCLSACIMSVEEKMRLEKELRDIKYEYYKNKEIEFKSNFLRYANPSRPEPSILKLYDQQRYEEMMSKIKSLIMSAQVKLISVVIDKKLYWKQYPSQKPYESAYAFLLESIQKELASNNEYGLVIIDPREGGVEKSFVGDNIKNIHNDIRFKGTDYLEKSPNVVEKLLYSTSDDTIGIQVCDILCYPVWHIFEYDKKPAEYEWFQNVTKLKLRSVDGKINEYGIKLFPEDTKKTLKMFESHS